MCRRLHCRGCAEACEAYALAAKWHTANVMAMGSECGLRWDVFRQLHTAAFVRRHVRHARCLSH